MELSSTDQNVIRLIAALITLFVCFGAAGAVSADKEGLFTTVSWPALLLAILAVSWAPDIYKATMEDSTAILKVSLLIALVLSFVGLFFFNLFAVIAAVVFVISPVLYDFVRDIAFPSVPKEIPWSRRELGTRLLEILLEATIGSIISAVITYAIARHL